MVKGGFKRFEFGIFLVNLINYIKSIDSISYYVFYMDNARIHHAKDLKEVF